VNQKCLNIGVRFIKNEGVNYLFTIYDLRRKHEKEEEEFKQNCKHTFKDGTSAIEIYIDDENYEDEENNIYYYATYEEWERCKICGMQRKFN
jgi:hypothetical protein